MSRVTRIWTIADVIATEVVGTGIFRPADDDDSGGEGGGEGGRSLVAGMAVRPLQGQRVQVIELAGDERFLPIEELDARIDRLARRDSQRE
ncbi:MAG: hypothetical protein LC791_12740 [Acidobacteria bacterium]|nr:hypothetical protein [Acidobacteriota bacterium]